MGKHSNVNLIIGKTYIYEEANKELRARMSKDEIILLAAHIEDNSSKGRNIFENIHSIKYIIFPFVGNSEKGYSTKIVYYANRRSRNNYVLSVYDEEVNTYRKLKNYIKFILNIITRIALISTTTGG